jgi:hypothetical protein
MEQIEDAGFITPPRGLYKLRILSAAIKGIGKEGSEQKEGIVLDIEIVETLNLANKTDKECPAGSKFNISYIGGGGATYFKTDFADVAKGLGTATLRDLLPALSNVEITSTISLRADQNDKDKFYPQLKDVDLSK